MQTEVTVTAAIRRRNVSLTQVVASEDEAKETIKRLLALAGELSKDNYVPADVPEQPGKVTNAQLRALWAKALAQGWDRTKVKGFLDEKLGTHKAEEIVGQVDRKPFSDLIDGVGTAS